MEPEERGRLGWRWGGGGWGEGRLSGERRLAPLGARSHPVSLPLPPRCDLTLSLMPGLQRRGCHFLPHQNLGPESTLLPRQGSLGSHSDKDGWLSPPHAPQPLTQQPPPRPDTSHIISALSVLFLFLLGRIQIRNPRGKNPAGNLPIFHFCFLSHL